MIGFLKRFKYIFIVFLLVFIGRGFLYRTLIHYKKVGNRPSIVLENKELINHLNMEISKGPLSKTELIRLTNQLTTESLEFTSNRVSSNPNRVYASGRANCVGYAALFNSIGNYILKANGLGMKFKLNHVYGKIHFLGINVHQLSQSAFFKDHDYNIIEDLETKESIKVDPSVSDYLGIDSVK